MLRADRDKKKSSAGTLSDPVEKEEDERVMAYKEKMELIVPSSFDPPFQLHECWTLGLHVGITGVASNGVGLVGKKRSLSLLNYLVLLLN